MPLSESRKAANQRWKAQNKATVACTLYKRDAEDFRALARKRGTTVNALLCGYVSQELGRPLEKRTENREEE